MTNLKTKNYLSMMKKNPFTKGKFLEDFLLISALTLGACVNNIPHEASTESEIPIRFVAEVNSQGNTKVLNAAFEEEDKIGLFACIEGTELNEERYIDNLELTCEKENVLAPKETVFYPQGGSKLNFTAYYPYQKNALHDGGTTMTLHIQEDQSDHGNFSESDFLIAKQKGITSSEEPVTLNFRHALSKLEIVIIPENDSQLKDMLEDSPVIIACNFYSQAEYDLKEETINSRSVPADIIASGEWQESDGKLIGKRVIVIPQNVTPDQQHISIEWDGRIFTTELEAYDLQANSQRTIEISMRSVEDNVLSGMVGKIEDWGESSVQEETEASLETKGIHTASLSFKASNIYHLYNEGEIVAEICKEYLLADNISAQAIVAYPMTGQNADLSHGTVLKILDETGNVHGGKVCWNEETNELEYQEGSSEPVRVFYVTPERNIVCNGQPEEALTISISSYTLKERRQNEVHEYPLVKIGTQYWMKESLKETCYLDKTELPHLTEQGDYTPGYYKPDGVNAYFYNGEAILGNTLAPRGWRIPSTEDWEILSGYIRNEAAILRAGEWEPLDIEESLLPCSNLAGFDGYPEGMWHRGQHWNALKMVGYWTLDNDGTKIPEETVFLVGTNSEITLSSTVSSIGDFYKALSVRCVRID